MVSVLTDLFFVVFIVTFFGFSLTALPDGRMFAVFASYGKAFGTKSPSSEIEGAKIGMADLGTTFDPTGLSFRCMTPSTLNQLIC
jgi:hypothetical protein